MGKFLLLVVFLAWCKAAPFPGNQDDGSVYRTYPLLDRPAPIHPDIPSDPRPEEKVTLIEDSSKIKRQTDKKEVLPAHPGPVALQDHEDEKKHKHMKRENRDEDCHERKVPKREDNPKPTEVPKENTTEIRNYEGRAKRETKESQDKLEKNKNSKDEQTDQDKHKHQKREQNSKPKDEDHEGKHPRNKRETNEDQSGKSSKDKHPETHTGGN